MKGRVLVALVVLTLLCGCESYHRSFVNAGKVPGGNEVGVPASQVDKARSTAQNGPDHKAVVPCSAEEPIVDSPTLGGGVLPSDPATGRPDLTALPVGAFCRVDLVRPVGRGQAYQGKVVRLEKDAVVLSNVISEGPMKRSRRPSLKDLFNARMPWLGGEEVIDWQVLPDKEFRVARSEVSAARILDHDPLADYYQR